MDVKFTKIAKQYDKDLAEWIINTCRSHSEGKCEVQEKTIDNDKCLQFPEACALDCRARTIKHSKFILNL